MMNDERGTMNVDNHHSSFIVPRSSLPLLVFAKAPIPGRTKTRLAGKLGKRGAARLQARLVRRTLATATRAGVAVQLWCDPHAAHPFFASCRRTFPLTLHTQHGGDLGVRMRQALSQTLRNNDCAVLIGTDCPVLTPALLRRAFGALRNGADVVLGPAEDGGYVLIGVHRRAPARLFRGIAWGSDRVLAQTRQRLRQLGLRWVELPTLRDVDWPEDLSHLRTLGATDGKLAQ